MVEMTQQVENLNQKTNCFKEQRGNSGVET